MKSKLFLAALLAAGSFCAPAFSAAPTPMQTLDIRYASTAAGMVTQLQLPLGGTRPANYVVGNYNFDTSVPEGSFLGYCADPFQWASGSFHTYQAMALSDHVAPDSARYDTVSKLFGHAYQGSLLGATKAAGFQLALWEVFNDDGNLATGAVRTTARTNAGVVSEAQSLLAALPTWSDVGVAYDLMFYSNASYQDYIAVASLAPSVVPAIPEPESYALMLAGLGLLGWSAGRRKLR
jgi:hypothetical protein